MKIKFIIKASAILCIIGLTYSCGNANKKFEKIEEIEDSIAEKDSDESFDKAVSFLDSLISPADSTLIDSTETNDSL